MKKLIGILSALATIAATFLYYHTQKKSDKNYILTKTLNELNGYDY